ncbi:sulfotransferase family 2 domain-containing protein [Mesorhizobium caraganae]|uniref:sulfotransferase family 2 domain-containing protein n=1 Tax=Mesorhizobium caraganae TaxID=483206 RepID=UPI003336B9C6
MDRCYIFPHVPKCGGTSLLHHLQNSELNVLLDYEAWTGPMAIEKNRMCENVDFSQYDLIYGHFPIDRYESPNYGYIALVRDPIERCISNYTFHRDLSISEPDGKDFYNRLGKWIARGELSFIEYLHIAPDMTAVYSHFMKYWSRRRFDLIGTTANYGTFLNRLSELLGVKFENTIQERKCSTSITLTPEDRIMARELLAVEYKWYDEFIKSAV